MGLFDCDCACAAPPDFGPIAAANEKAAKIAARVAEKELKFRKQQYRQALPSIRRLRRAAEQIAKQQGAIAKEQLKQGKEAQKRFQREFAPVERQVILDALGLPSLSREVQREFISKLTPRSERSRQNVIQDLVFKATEAEADRAQNTAAQSAARARQQAMREAARRGLNPARFTAFSADLARSQALAEATAANQARQQAIGKGVGLRSGVANLGRGLPNVAGGNIGLALTAGNAAIGNRNTGAQASLPFSQFVAEGFQAPFQAAALRQQGALGLGGLQADVFRSNAAQLSAQKSSPFADILGTGLGLVATKFI